MARILIVDDHPPNLALLDIQLAPQGYEVIQAETGEDALEILSNSQVDLILCDVVMPGIDGYEVTRRVRQSEPNKLLPIILLTSLQEKEDRIKGIEAGCDDFLIKPFDKIELLARVKSLLKVKAYNDLKKDYQKELEFEIAKRTAELNHAYELVKSASLDTIYRLSIASGYRDEETGGHIKRMSWYSSAIARKLGLDKNMVETILYAAPLHDLGKIGIPDHILLKPGKFTSEEWEIMKQHTVIGAKILQGSNAEYIKLGEIIALSHHEKWDGSGYPKGLKGKDIPIAGRIVAIADVFDALTSKRPYKEAFSLDSSLNIIKQGSGIHFDPDIVEAFFSILDEILTIKAQFNDALISHDSI